MIQGSRRGRCGRAAAFRSPGHPRGLLRVALVGAIGIAPMGCGQPGPTGTPPASGDPVLAVLSAGAAETTIDVRPADGRVLTVPQPPGASQWLAADGEGRLLATLVDGRLVRSTGSIPALPGWQTVPVASPRGARTPLSFAVPDASGRRIAALVADWGSGTPSSLAVVVGDSLARMLDLSIEANGAPPAWLDDRRVVVAGLSPTGGLRVVVVDTEAGTSSAGPPGIRAVAVSADGRRLATVGADQRTIDVLPAGGLTAGATSEPARAPGPETAQRVPPEPIGVVSGLALDASGRSLAVVWTDADLVPSVVVRYEDGDGWRERARIRLAPATVRAAVAWLPG